MATPRRGHGKNEGWLHRASGTIVTRRVVAMRPDGTLLVAYERKFLFGNPPDTCLLFLGHWAQPADPPAPPGEEE